MALFNGKRRRADMLPSCFCISGSVGRNARFSFDICAETVQMSHEAERVDFIKDGYLSASALFPHDQSAGTPTIASVLRATRLEISADGSFRHHRREEYFESLAVRNGFRGIASAKTDTHPSEFICTEVIKQITVKMPALVTAVSIRVVVS